MAENQFSGLFGTPSPSEAREIRRSNLFNQFVKGSRAGGAGATLGSGIATAISGLFGDTPMVDRAQRMQRARSRIQNELGGIQSVVKDDNALRQAQGILQEEGLQQDAQQLFPQVLQLRQKMAETRPEVPESSRLVSGDSDLGRRLGVPAGETMEVKFRGNRIVGFEGVGSPETNIRLEQTPFDKAKTQSLDKKFERIRQSQSNARNSLRLISGLQDLIVQGDVQTGAIQPAVTTLQNISESAGLDLGGIAEAAGINMGDLSKKEEFDRLSKRLTINMFDKFKGNLNSKEVQIAEDAVSRLGTSKEGNMRALAAMRAAAELAQQRALRLEQAQSQEEFNSLEQEISQQDSEQFRTLRNRYFKQMMQESRQGRTPTEQPSPEQPQEQPAQQEDGQDKIDRLIEKHTGQ
jgi:hypothetical protein